jgi:hypothetical protein
MRLNRQKKKKKNTWNQSGKRKVRKWIVGEDEKEYYKNKTD